MRITYLYYILPFLVNAIWAECSDLDYAECIYWSDYCEWNDELQDCFETGGGGLEIEYGPYNYEVITEDDGIRNGPDYLDGLLYYPIDADLPYRSIIITPGFGGGSSTMSVWGEFFASYGYISLVIGPNDEINDSHEQRAFGLLDAIQTIKEENFRTGSPLNSLIDTTRFIVSGYSMGGGASQIALTLETVHHNNISGAIALNPTILIEDCDVCAESENCICLVPEFLEHETPILVISGEDELNEGDLSSDYSGLIGPDIYINTPETTTKILYEIEDGGHSSAELPTGYVNKKTLDFVQYLLMGNDSFCDSLSVAPPNASLFLNTLQCDQLFNYDFNEDGNINNTDLIMLVVSVLNSSEIQFDINHDQITNIFDILIFSLFIENL